MSATSRAIGKAKAERLEDLYAALIDSGQMYKLHGLQALDARLLAKALGDDVPATVPPSKPARCVIDLSHLPS